MIIVFIGRPESGKGTQAKLLSRETGLPVFAMGDLIRQAVDTNPDVALAYEQYALEGRHLPNSIKFPLLQDQLDTVNNGFILDNYPATQEDLETFNSYLTRHRWSIARVFNIVISPDEVVQRMKLDNRGRLDDDERIIRERIRIQDRDRDDVIAYFREKAMLEEIDGEREIGIVHGDIMSRLGISRQEKNGL